MREDEGTFFFPLGYTETLYQQLHTLRQSGRIIDEYTNDFYQLVVRNDTSEIEEKLVVRYLNGLHRSFQDEGQLLRAKIKIYYFYPDLWRRKRL